LFVNCYTGLLTYLLTYTVRLTAGLKYKKENRAMLIADISGTFVSLHVCRTQVSRWCSANGLQYQATSCRQSFKWRRCWRVYVTSPRLYLSMSSTWPTTMYVYLTLSPASHCWLLQDFVSIQLVALAAVVLPA